MSTNENLALYRQWRPQSFRDVVSQKQVIFPLVQSIRSGKFAHAFVFSGTRGTGKTSVAKIFAKAINCLQPDEGNPCNECEICRAANNSSLMDIQEIDAASNNGVDDVRRLTSEIIFTPVLAKYKVYIIDEVHMLSQQAFNALLKTLEEPPAHAVFILATTEPHRIPATIMSRCQHYEFRRISMAEIKEHLRVIADDLRLSISDDALLLIAQLANGGMRDAISLLDQVRQLPDEEIGRDSVLEMAGRVPDQFMHSVAKSILHYDPDSLLSSVQEVSMSGRDLSRFILELSAYMRNLLVSKVSHNPADLIQMTSDGLKSMSELAETVSVDSITESIAALARLSSELRFSPDIRTSLEIALLALAAQLNGISPADDIKGRARAVKAEQTEKSYEKKPAPSEPVSVNPVISSAPSIESKQQVTKPIPAREELYNENFSREAEAADSLSSLSAPPEQTDLFGINQPEEKAEPARIIPQLAEPADQEHRTAEDAKTLAIWQEALNKIKAEHLMDLSLMARPAEVKRTDNLWTLSFGPKLRGQYTCINEAESRATICRILSDILDESIQLEVVLSEEEESGRLSAEEDWMLKFRKEKDNSTLHISEDFNNGGNN